MTSRALRMLYRELPKVEGCKPDCGKCCGPVPWSPEELQKVADRIPDHAAYAPAPSSGYGMVMMLDSRGGTTCPMLGEDKRCTVYDARPAMCRLFGASDAPGLRCPFGARARNPWPDRKARAWVDRYKAASA